MRGLLFTSVCHGRAQLAHQGYCASSALRLSEGSTSRMSRMRCMSKGGAFHCKFRSLVAAERLQAALPVQPPQATSHPPCRVGAAEACSPALWWAGPAPAPAPASPAGKGAKQRGSRMGGLRELLSSGCLVSPCSVCKVLAGQASHALTPHFPTRGCCSAARLQTIHSSPSLLCFRSSLACSCTSLLLLGRKASTHLQLV